MLFWQIYHRNNSVLYQNMETVWLHPTLVMLTFDHVVKLVSSLFPPFYLFNILWEDIQYCTDGLFSIISPKPGSLNIL